MSDPFVGEVKMFAGNFAPYGYSLCQGQLMSISQNNALFAVLGVMYGGDGRSTFGLPNLCGTVPLGQGQAPGVSASFVPGETGGQESVTLLSTNMPNHSHQVRGSLADGSTNVPSNNAFLAAATDAAGTPVNIYGDTNDSTTKINVNVLPQSVGVSGGQLPFSLRNPYVAITFIIALWGEYPMRP
ncbi:MULTISPECIES: phage tail protein [Pseudomonas]|uniref:phage tail protein n=1 Tax=Pseudomonas TaxID=286 RepID=UPI002DB711FB|nr:tail fiber protein [Pseudomonas asiatica]MEB6587970.1 tail fiber protein [Pseudomonas asiatica]